MVLLLRILLLRRRRLRIRRFCWRRLCLRGGLRFGLWMRVVRWRVIRVVCLHLSVVILVRRILVIMVFVLINLMSMILMRRRWGCCLSLLLGRLGRILMLLRMLFAVLVL